MAEGTEALAASETLDGPGSPASGRSPQRTCIGCRTRRSQGDLIRIVQAPDATLETGRTLPGRGAWLCRASPDCFDAAARRGGFARAFRTAVDARAVEALRTAIGLEQDPSTNDFPHGHPPARD